MISIFGKYIVTIPALILSISMWTCPSSRSKCKYKILLYPLKHDDDLDRQMTSICLSFGVDETVLTECSYLVVWYWRNISSPRWQQTLHADFVERFPLNLSSNVSYFPTPFFTHPPPFLNDDLLLQSRRSSYSHTLVLMILPLTGL